MISIEAVVWHLIGNAWKIISIEEVGEGVCECMCECGVCEIKCIKKSEMISVKGEQARLK